MNTHVSNKPIYFELDEVENIAEEEATVTLDYTPPVILPEDIELETIMVEPEPLPSLTANALSSTATMNPWLSSFPSASPWLWLVGSLGLLLILMLLFDTFYFIAEQYTRSFLLGTLFFSIILCITGAVLILTWRAYQSIVTLRTVAALQQEGRQLMATTRYGHAIHYINRVAQFYLHRPDVKTRLEQFYLTLKDTHHDREICTLFSTQVMKEIDQQAYYIVVQRSKETALFVMISQLAWLDALLSLWRNVRMIQDIAALYGGRPSLLGSITLITNVLQNLIYANVSETVADGMAEILGGSMLSVFSTQMAQGLGSSVLTARIGLHTMQACRPLPFLEAEKPRLKEVRREVIKSLKKLVATSENQDKTA